MGRKGKINGFPPALVAAAVMVGLIVGYPRTAAAVFVIGLIVGGIYWADSRRGGARRREQRLAYSLEELDQLSGAEFEAWVTEVLNAASIPAENIQHTGDFGVDVVATVDGTRVGIQVKRYASSIGNSAVQEALAGSGYHDCELAAVVTQSTYTRAARKQAARARVPVLLVDRENIHDLPQLVREFAAG